MGRASHFVNLETGCCGGEPSCGVMPERAALGNASPCIFHSPEDCSKRCHAVPASIDSMAQCGPGRTVTAGPLKNTENPQKTSQAHPSAKTALRIGALHCQACGVSTHIQNTLLAHTETPLVPGRDPVTRLGTPSALSEVFLAPRSTTELTRAHSPTPEVGREDPWERALKPECQQLTEAGC